MEIKKNLCSCLIKRCLFGLISTQTEVYKWQFVNLNLNQNLCSLTTAAGDAVQKNCWGDCSNRHLVTVLMTRRVRICLIWLSRWLISRSHCTVGWEEALQVKHQAGASLIFISVFKWFCVDISLKFITSRWALTSVTWRKVDHNSSFHIFFIKRGVLIN